MSFTVNRRNLGAQHFIASGANLVFPGICRFPSNFYMLNPSTVNGLSGTKSSTFTSSQLSSNFVLSTSSDITVLASDYADSNWASLGWTSGTDATFYTELSSFVQNNFGNTTINPELRSMAIMFARGTVGGVAYTIPFAYVAKFGDLDNLTAFLLHLDNTLNDSSSNALTAASSTAITYSTGMFGQAASFNGSTSVVTYNTGITGSPFDFGSSDFTIDFWFQTTNGSEGAHTPIIGLMDSVNGSLFDWQIQMSGGGVYQTFFSATGGTIGPNSTVGTYHANVWQHVALVRSGNSLVQYHNGVSVLSGTLSGSLKLTNPSVIRIGNDAEGLLVDELRISNIARWTSGFTVPAGAYTPDANTLLLCHFDGGLTDSSSQNSQLSVSGGSVNYVTGQFGQAVHLPTSVFINIPFCASSPFYLGSDPFTYDFWFNTSTVNSSNHDIMGGPNLFILSNGGVRAITSGLLDFSTPSNVYSANTWNHVALVRSGTSGKFWGLFVNGVLEAFNSTATGFVGVPPTIFLGNAGQGAGIEQYPGLVDEFRLSKAARWPIGNFTPPTSAVSADASTSLLLPFDNSVADTSGHSNVVTTTGSSFSYVAGQFGQGAKITSGAFTIPFTAGGLFDFGSGDFTIDFWLNPNTTGYGPHTPIFTMYDTSIGSGFNLQIQISGGNVAQTFVTTSGGTISPASFNPVYTSNAWQHVAVVRNGNLLFQFIGGQFCFATAISGAISVSSPTHIQFEPGFAFDDFRVTKNLARWPANFTPPTGPY